MNISRHLAGLAALCLGSQVLAQEGAAELKQKILSQAQNISADDYAFTRTVRNDGNMGGQDERTVVVEKYDPSQPAEARWSLVTVNGGPPPADALEKFRKESQQRRVPGYHRLASYVGLPAATAMDAQGRTLFRFASLPKDSVTVMQSDVSQNASAEVVVNTSGSTPFAEQVRVSVKPMRLKLVMKLNSYDSTSRYRLGAEGKPLLVEQTAELSDSGMGREGRLKSVITYSDYRAVRAQH